MESVTRDVVFPNFNETRCTSLPTLTCRVYPTTDSKTEGSVFFSPEWQARANGSEEMACYTRVKATIVNLVASGKHGFHIHTYGDLSKDDGTSTGGHFTNPAGEEIPHGFPVDSERHWGDLGNLEAGANGQAEYDRVDDVIRLGGIVGRAITIHAGDDKGPSEQPSGDAGSRIGYCVIGYANPDM